MPTTDPYFLSHGKHQSPDDGRCAMEWVAYLAGEEHSDSPVCVSPVLRRFGVSLNDRLNEVDRQQLRPYLARCIGTAGDGRDPERMQILAEFVLRRSLPGHLDEAGLQEAAQRVRALPLDLTLAHVRETLVDVGEVARSARQRRYEELRSKFRKFRKRWSAAAADAAYAAADAYAAAAADAAYAAAASPSMTYDQVYAACKKAADKALAPRRQKALRDALDLFDRLLPKEVIQLPVADDAAAVCALEAIHG